MCSNSAAAKGAFLTVRALCLSCLAVLLAASALQAQTVQFVPVGNPGNAPDPALVYDDWNYINLGQVDYNYRIGTYDITVGEYTAFLNAVAKTDPYNLYSSQETRGNILLDAPGIIQRSGSPGSYSYSIYPADGGTETVARLVNLPDIFVSWADAARYCNWLQNGCPTTGVEIASTTEQGAYTLSGATSEAALDAVSLARNPRAQYFLPTENEWYKAAYYKTGRTNAGYWLYPNCSNTPPVNTLSATGTNNANFCNNGTYTDPTYQGMTPVGAFASSPGPYGTFDMVGNVAQWCENGDTPDDGYYADNRVFMGAWFSSPVTALGSAATYSGSSGGLLPMYSIATTVPTSWDGSYNTDSDPNATDYDYGLGFRVASIPSLTWTASGGGAWNTTASNTPWSDGKNPAAYSDPGLTATTFTVPCCFVTFPQLNGGTTAITIQSSGVSPASLAFSNTSGVYVLSGGPIQGPTSLSVSGGGKVVLANSNTYTGGTTVSAGTLQLGDAASDGFVAGNITDNAALVFANLMPQTYSGSISGSGSLTKIAAGLLILSDTNSYTGGTYVEAGTLEVTRPAGLPSGTSLTMDAGGTFIFDPSRAVAAPITSSAAAQINSVPEPRTLALLVIALCGAAVGQHIRSRRKKQLSAIVR
ncbi:MAG: SUMF1/EgtB/PvdO family nonheme iron enzyme [Thermoguttaceae bacterium]